MIKILKALILTALILFLPFAAQAEDFTGDKFTVKGHISQQEIATPAAAPPNFHRVFMSTTGSQLMSIDSTSELRTYVYMTTTAAVINEDGADIDTRIETLNQNNFFTVDAAQDTLILKSEADAGEVFAVRDSAAQALFTINTGGGGQANGSEAVFNDIGLTYGFRVEGLNATDLFRVLAAEDTVEIKSEANAGNVFIVRDSQGFSLVTYELGTGGIAGGVETIFNQDGRNRDLRIEGNTEQNLLFVDGGIEGIGIGTKTLAPWSTVRHPIQWDGDGGAIWQDAINFNMSVNMYDAGSQDIYVMNPAQGAAMLRLTSPVGNDGSFDLKVAPDGINGITWQSVFSGGTIEAVINNHGNDINFRVESDDEANAFFVDAGNDNIGINTGTPDTSATLDIVSTTRGFLPPRMTTTQRDAIASPAEGLVIYNTTTKVLNFYNGAVWGAV